MTRKQKVTIKEVAKAAGVSTQTVSRVINHRPDVSPETKQRVQNIIDELGYSPNVLARSLVRGRSNTLGVVGFGLGYFGPTSILKGIEKRTFNLGFSLLLSLMDDFDPSHIDAILKNLLSRQVEGIIWAVPGNNRLTGQLSVRFKEIPVPVVYLNKPKRVDDLVVALDNRLGARLAAKHLLSQGYRHVGIITGPMDWWEAQQRESGWRQVMQENGGSDLDNLVVAGDWSAYSGNAGLQELLARSPHIDAVFASNDQMALGALQAARQLGIRVPQELGIVGFDDIPEAAFFYPSLTTIRQDAQALGANAVDQICDFILARRDGDEFKSDIVWVSPELIVRNSSNRGQINGSY
ncbi:MAG: LacI family DNA-binding transcriptional regulator [Anaerolineales bacterium]